MAKTILTAARVKALRPRKTSYEMRDVRLRGFGVRVLATGRKRFFVQCQHRGVRRLEDRGRHRGHERRGGVGFGPRGDPAGRGGTAPSRRDGLRGRRHGRVRALRAAVKAGDAVRQWLYLRNQLLSHFAGRPIAEIDQQEVRNWFAALRATPVAADRSLPVLSVIMREAETMGLRPEGSNPCRGLKRYRRKGRVRFLSDADIRRLSVQLQAHEARWPEQAALVRLLLLTGCRKSEILTLQWSDYRKGHLFLHDSKTGPRTVWLSQPARTILDGLARKTRADALLSRCCAVSQHRLTSCPSPDSAARRRRPPAEGKVWIHAQSCSYNVPK